MACSFTGHTSQHQPPASDTSAASTRTTAVTPSNPWLYECGHHPYARGSPLYTPRSKYPEAASNRPLAWQTSIGNVTGPTPSYPPPPLGPCALPSHPVATLFFQLLRPKEAASWQWSSSPAQRQVSGTVPWNGSSGRWGRRRRSHCCHLAQLPPLARILASFLTGHPAFALAPFQFILY